MRRITACSSVAATACWWSTCPRGSSIATIAGTAGVHGIALRARPAPRLHQQRPQRVGHRVRPGLAEDRSAPSPAPARTPMRSSTTPPRTTSSPSTATSASASVIDPARRAVIATIALPGKPEFAQADGAGHVYVNIEDKSELVEIDALQQHACCTPGRWRRANRPAGWRWTTRTTGCSRCATTRTMAVTDATIGQARRHRADRRRPGRRGLRPRPPARSTAPTARAARSPRCTQDDPDHYRVTATVPTQVSARTLALDPATHRLYLSAATPGPKKNARGWHEMLPDSFVLVVVGPR